MLPLLTEASGESSQVKKFFIPSKENVGATHKNKDGVHR